MNHGFRRRSKSDFDGKATRVCASWLIGRKHTESGFRYHWYHLSAKVSTESK